MGGGWTNAKPTTTGCKIGKIMQIIKFYGRGIDGCNTYNKWMSKYTNMQVQNGQDNAKYSILWVGVRWVQHLQQGMS